MIFTLKHVFNLSVEVKKRSKQKLKRDFCRFYKNKAGSNTTQPTPTFF